MSVRPSSIHSHGGTLLVLVWATTVGSSAGVWPQTARIDAVSSYTTGAMAAAAKASSANAQEMVRSLRDAGLPMAAIAEMARVERKTVYAWLDGGEARAERESRLAEIHALLIGSRLDLHALWRVSGRPLTSGMNLKQALGSEVLDEQVIREAFAELQPAVERQMLRAAVRIPSRFNTPNPILDNVPTADLG